MSIFRHLNIVVWTSEIAECPQLPLTSENGKEEQISGSKCFAAVDYCKLGRYNQGKYHCILAVLQISPYTAHITKIRPKQEDCFWDDTVKLFLCPFPQTQGLKIASHCKNTA